MALWLFWPLEVLLRVIPMSSGLALPWKCRHYVLKGSLNHQESKRELKPKQKMVCSIQYDLGRVNNTQQKSYLAETSVVGEHLSLDHAV